MAEVGDLTMERQLAVVEDQFMIESDLLLMSTGDEPEMEYRRQRIDRLLDAANEIRILGSFAIRSAELL